MLMGRGLKEKVWAWGLLLLFRIAFWLHFSNSIAFMFKYLQNKLGLYFRSLHQSVHQHSRRLILGQLPIIESIINDKSDKSTVIYAHRYLRPIFLSSSFERSNNLHLQLQGRMRKS